MYVISFERPTKSGDYLTSSKIFRLASGNKYRVTVRKGLSLELSVSSLERWIDNVGWVYITGFNPHRFTECDAETPVAMLKWDCFAEVYAELESTALDFD